MSCSQPLGNPAPTNASVAAGGTYRGEKIQMYVHIERWDALVSVFPKCGCQNMRRFLLDTMKRFPREGDPPLPLNGWGLKALSAVRAQKKLSEKTVVVEIVREPTSRLVSAYLSKFVRPETKKLLPSVTKFIGMINKEREDFTFDDFLKGILDHDRARAVLLTDAHFRPLSELALKPEFVKADRFRLQDMDSLAWVNRLQEKEPDIDLRAVYSSYQRATYLPENASAFYDSAKSLTVGELQVLMRESREKPSEKVFESPLLTQVIENFYPFEKNFYSTALHPD